MKILPLQKITYSLVSLFIVLPIFKILFRGSVEGIKNLPKKNSFIIVSNHGSNFDPPFVGHALGLRVSFMAKAELFNIPLLSNVIKACGAYPVKRGTIDRDSLLTASTKLENEEVIGIFIDGTRQKDGRVNKPKKGAAMLAAKNKKYLVPVAIINSHRLFQIKNFIPRFNKVIIKIGNPISYPRSSSKYDINLTTNYLKDTINTLLG